MHRATDPRQSPPGDQDPSWRDGLFLDVRHALRGLRRQRAFVIAVVGVLGLGLGAATTLFTVVRAVLLRPIPLEDSGELVAMGTRIPGRRSLSMVSAPELMDIQRQLRSVQGLAAARGSALDLVGDGEAERVATSRVTAGFFEVLKVTPVLGRTFTAEEHARPGSNAAVVSYELWQRRWGGDPAIPGRTFVASEDEGDEEGFRTFTIVGVLPPGFRNPAPLESRFSRLPPAQIWTPLVLNGGTYLGSRTNWQLGVVGRLARGARLESLQRELDGLAASLLATYPSVHRQEDGTTLGLGAMSLRDAVVGDRGRDLLILLGATALLLLIACGNVAGLLLARAIDRDEEFRLRVALGAQRLRLARQLLTESTLLGILGGVVGMALTFIGVHAFRLLGPASFPRLEEISVDIPVLAFCLLLSLIAGLLSGLVPATLVSARALSAGCSSRVEGGRALGRGQGALIAGELAAAVVLLAGSGLLARSALRLEEMDPGIDPDNVILMQVSLPPSYGEGPPRIAFLDSLRERLAALPGVASASYVEDPPMGFNKWSPPIRTFENARVFEGAAHRVGEDYFRTMGIRLLSGRLLTRTDGEAARVVVLSKELAEQIWPGENALGRRIRMDDGPEAPWYSVVGVVNGIRQYGLDEGPAGEAYLPAALGGVARRTYLAVKTGDDPAALTGILRQAVWSLDSNVPIPEITTMKRRVDATLRLPRFRALLLSLFALLALTLVSAGVWGMVRYVVGRRTREIGIHMALGAQPGDVAARLLRQVLWPILGGVGVGLAGAFGATRLLDSVLFGVEAADPGTLLSSAAALAALGVLSAFFPIRRATSVNPAEALRSTQ